MKEQKSLRKINVEKQFRFVGLNGREYCPAGGDVSVDPCSKWREVGLGQVMFEMMGDQFG